MNIYFACSITGGREDEAYYQIIVDSLLADGPGDSRALDLPVGLGIRGRYDCCPGQFAP